MKNFKSIFLFILILFIVGCGSTPNSKILSPKANFPVIIKNTKVKLSIPEYLQTISVGIDG